MAGPLDILKSMAGTHSKTGVGTTAPAPKLPAMDSKTTKSYKELETTLKGIQKEMRGIATSTGATAELGNLAKKARKLQPLYKAIEDVKKAEAEYLKLMKSSTASIHKQVEAYNKLAAAKKKQVQVGNEMKGMFGRLKNVMGKSNILLGAFALVTRDVVLVARQANEGFDVMARSGQALGKSFAQLTAATASYSMGLNKAAISGAMMGHSGEESKKAFQLLTQTFGGTGDAVANVSSNFGDLATIAKFSGMSIGEAAAFADKNWKRLGKTMEDSAGDIAQMGMNTSHLNALFGAGKVDTREYAQTVSDLSFQSGNYNQNTKFLIESLNRELAVQLSLGKSRDAAMASARKNLEKAGNANLVGAQILGRKLQAEFNASGMTTSEAMVRFGSQGELVLSILEEGIEKGNNLFALAEIMKGSTEMQGELNKEVRRDAARGGSMGLVTGVTENIGQQLVLEREEKIRTAKFAAIRDAEQGDFKGITEKLEALFPGVEDIEDKEKRGEARELIAQFGRTIRKDPKVDAREEFAKIIEAIMPAEDPEKAKDPVDKFLEKVGGAKMFMNMIGTVTRLPEVIMGLPVSIALAIAAEKAGELLGAGGDASVGAWIKGLVTAEEDEFGTKQRYDQGGMPMFTKEQLAEGQRKKAAAVAKETLGEQYDYSKKAGRAEVQGLTREEYIDKRVKERQRERRIEVFGTDDTEAARLEMETVAAAGAGDPAAMAVLQTSGEAAATPATKLGSKVAVAPKKTIRSGAKGLPELEAEAFADGGDVLLRVKNLDRIAAQWEYGNSAQS